MANKASIAPTTFVHAELADGEIRLLEIQPRDSYGYLRFAMRTFVRANVPRYAALSYVWGPESKRTIFVDDAAFYVRRNLLDALASIVRRFEDISADERVFERSELAFETRKFLWIDAICIDQDKIDERNAQVSLMKQTYADAATVIVWLGTEEGDVDRDKFAPIAGPKTWKWRDNIRQLATRAYWSRIWVVQEFLVASDIIIVCGNHWVLERDFFERVEGLLDNCTARNFSNMTTYARASNDGEAQSLDAMLRLYHDNECSDPRDRIFALLGCIVTQEQEALAAYLPNYELSYNEVAIIALAHIMRFSGQVPTLDHILFRGTRPDFADKMLKIAFAFEVCRGSPWQALEMDFTDFGSTFRTHLQQLQDELAALGIPDIVGSQGELFHLDPSNLANLDQLDDRLKRFRRHVHTQEYLVADDPAACAKFLFYLKAGKWYSPNLREILWSGECIRSRS